MGYPRTFSLQKLDHCYKERTSFNYWWQWTLLLLFLTYSPSHSQEISVEARYYNLFSSRYTVLRLHLHYKIRIVVKQLHYIRGSDDCNVIVVIMDKGKLCSASWVKHWWRTAFCFCALGLFFQYRGSLPVDLCRVWRKESAKFAT